MTNQKKTKGLVNSYKSYTLKTKLIYSSEYDIDAIIDQIGKSFNIVADFYDGWQGSINITLELVYSRNEYDQIVGYKSEKWASGYSHDNMIAIFHPDLFETETTHKKDDFTKTLTHELAHAFDKFIFKDYLWWIHEGIAQYIANQDIIKKIEPQNIESFLSNNFLQNGNYKEFTDNQGHQISKQLVFAIAKEKGKESLLELSKVKPTDGVKDQIAEILGVNNANLESQVKSIILKEISNDFEQI